MFIKKVEQLQSKLIENNLDGMLVDIDNEKISLGIIGEFNLYNILSVYVFSKILKINKIKSLSIISKIKPPFGACEF